MTAILTFSSLFPNAAQPGLGLFVRERMLRLREYSGFDFQVMAPVPWFPAAARVFGRYAVFARVPRTESVAGIPVSHPRYPVLPGVGMSVAPLLMALALRSEMLRLLKSGRHFDVIDAHYFYPDGIAAAILGKWLGKPVVITARGSDINLIGDYWLPRRWIAWAVRHSAAIVTVSGALRDRLCALTDLDPSFVRVLRNGVDLERFAPLDQGAARREIGVDRRGPVILSVGNLLADKGHGLVLEAVATLPNAQLVIVGQGPEEASLRRRAEALGVAGRLTLAGFVEQQQLPKYYSSADLLVLASVREGMPNVILEAMSCGTPVVATAVGGIPEVVSDRVGILVTKRTPQALREAIETLLAAPKSREAIRKHAESFSWDATSRGQAHLFEEVCR